MNKLSFSIAVFLTGTLLTMGCEKVVKTETEASEKTGETAKAVVIARDSAAAKTSHWFKKLFTRKKVRAEEVTKESKASVHQLYPEMEIIEWESAPEYIVESENDTVEVFEVIHPEVYIVTLKKDDELTKAKLLKEGQFLESRKILVAEKIPPAIQETLRNGTYKDWKIMAEQEEIKRTTEKELIYRIVIEKDNQKKILYFTKNGKLVKTLNTI